jgi:Domain of unknown function (DUF5679)
MVSPSSRQSCADRPERGPDGQSGNAGSISCLEYRRSCGLKPPARLDSPEEDTMAVNGYCLKCKTSVEIKDAQAITMKNGKPATKGTCPTCGTTIFKIGKAA